ncbi:unnamed protein product [Phyllotreta striolata]|uniref:Uncharacterized protein n=1 Tax=Phyllotreta striolata TaxID=444603 RepID=A0A9N9TM56_PHYSR|nr:unnamed protein product [Phyllotreta striolata]
MGSAWSMTTNSSARLAGKTAVITGANTGIGKVTAKNFYERGARVILACRSVEKAQQAVDDIKRQCDGKEDLGQLEVQRLDLSSLKSVRACAEDLLKSESRINMLVNNAGIMNLPKLTRNEDGNEMQFATNHLGHFLLTVLLMPVLLQSAPARIVNVSSRLHFFTLTLNVDDLNFEKRRYGPTRAYIQSKLCNVLFTKELAEKLKENRIEGVNVYSLHPGVINTELKRHMDIPMKSILRKFTKTPEEGALTTIYCATNEKCARETGLYYQNCKSTYPSWIANNRKISKKLWDASWTMAGLKEDFQPFEVKKL